MNVTLIDYTGAGTEDPARHAANILLFAKSTRLTMAPDLLEAIQNVPTQQILDELEYIANTIPSSWEFVDYTFLLSDVTRAFTHQFVRTRTGSYAQQTMRVLDVAGWTFGTGPTIDGNPEFKAQYDQGMATIAETYDKLIEQGASIEDARGILPTNIHTNIVAKFDLRTLCDMFRKRASKRTQGEYRQVIEGMKAEVLRVHPWTELFLKKSFDGAAMLLEDAIHSMELEKEEKIRLTKLIDQMRGKA